jgi:hypothetical protein
MKQAESILGQLNQGPVIADQSATVTIIAHESFRSVFEKFFNYD